MWPDSVVVHAPAFRQHVQFLDRVEDFAVQQLVSEFRVERFAVAVLPRRTGFDVQCFGARVAQLLAQVFGHELTPITPREGRFR